MNTTNLAAVAATPPPAFQDFWVLLSLIAAVSVVAVAALIVAARAFRAAQRRTLVTVDEVWQATREAKTVPIGRYADGSPVTTSWPCASQPHLLDAGPARALAAGERDR